ncbi:E3 ubiquitin-protein ligase TRIM63-like [Saccoglossus kowalevskii]
MAAAAKCSNRTGTGSLESELTCPVCWEIFKQPLKLPCEHDLCRECADSLLKSQFAISGRQPRSFRCPECREKVVIDGRGIDSLRRNVRLQNIIERFVCGNTSATQKDENVVDNAVMIEKTASAKGSVGANLSVEQIKEILSSENEELFVANNEIEDFIEEMGNFKYLIKKDAAKCKAAVDSEIDMLISAILKRKQYIKEKIVKQQLEKIRMVEHQIRDCRKLLGHGLNTALYIEDILEEFDETAMVQNFGTLKQR